MRILSVNPSHDASAMILNDGEIECYFKEERLSKRKKDKMPFTLLPVFPEPKPTTAKVPRTPMAATPNRSKSPKKT